MKLSIAITLLLVFASTGAKGKDDECPPPDWTKNALNVKFFCDDEDGNASEEIPGLDDKTLVFMSSGFGDGVLIGGGGNDKKKGTGDDTLQGGDGWDDISKAIVAANSTFHLSCSSPDRLLRRNLREGGKDPAFHLSCSDRQAEDSNNYFIAPWVNKNVVEALRIGGKQLEMHTSCSSPLVQLINPEDGDPMAGGGYTCLRDDGSSCLEVSAYVVADPDRRHTLLRRHLLSESWEKAASVAVEKASTTCKECDPFMKAFIFGSA